MKKNKIVILGASSDIGIELTKKFLKQGHSVIAHYNKNNEKLFNLKNKNKNLKIFSFDLSKINEFKKFVDYNRKMFDAEVFVSLTGYIKPATIEDISIKDFYDHLNINYLSSIIVLQKTLKYMKKNKFGRAILSSSTGVKFGGGLSTGVYSLTKYMNQFQFSNFSKYAKYNVLINSIQIPVTNTKIHKKVKKKNISKRIKLIPIKRMANINEVVNYLEFYCSRNNTLTTNSIIDISGGE